MIKNPYIIDYVSFLSFLYIGDKLGTKIIFHFSPLEYFIRLSIVYIYLLLLKVTKI